MVVLDQIDRIYSTHENESDHMRATQMSVVSQFSQISQISK